MVKVTIDLHSATDNSIKNLSTIEISNDGTGTQDIGNYDVKVGKNSRKARVIGYRRKKDSVHYLLYLALAAYYGKKV